MDSSSPHFSSSTTGVISGQSHGNFSDSFPSSSHQSFSNASFLLTSLKSSRVNFLEACFGFQFFLNTVFVGVLCIFGFAGNTISFLVFQRDRHNRVPVFLLQSLAVADNSVLLTAFIALSVVYGLVPIFGEETGDRIKPYMIRYLNPLGYAAQSCTIWMTVLLAINRYLAVCRPFTSQKWLKMTRARIQVFIVVFFSLLVNVPRVFEDDIHRIAANSAVPSVGTTNFSDSTSSSSATETATSDPKAYWYFEVVYLNAFYTSLILILPLLLLVGFNIPLLHQLQASKRQMIRNSLLYTGQQENNITVVMVIIILEMIVCHSPDRVVQIIMIIFSKDSQACPSPLYYAINIANFLVILNSSTDFIVYYVFRNRFRTILYDQVLCRRPRSNSRDVVAWNSRADHGASPLVRVNSNGQGASPVQRIEEDDQARTHPSPENDHQTASLVRKNDLLETEQDHHRTSFVL